MSKKEFKKELSLGYEYLDGLRGIGAFSVYLWHVWEKYVITGPLRPNEVAPILQFVRSSPLNLFLAG